MTSSYYNNPLVIIQTISIVKYVNILNDLLVAENFLRKKDQYKNIPIVNALCTFQKVNYEEEEKQVILARKIIEGCGLYGREINKTLDFNFVRILFNHIISSLVFDQFGNIYGFILTTFVKSKDDQITTLIQDIINTLQNLKFDNEDGEYSTLDSLSILKIVEELIIPLFPLPLLGKGIRKSDLKPSKYRIVPNMELRFLFPLPENVSITSVNYIYAQAGFMFFRSDQTDLKIDTYKNIFQRSSLFEQCTYIAQLIEHLIIVGDINEKAMRIFVLPALLNYVRKKDKQFLPKNIVDILYDEKHWQNAFNLLFSHLTVTFDKVDKALDNITQYQFRKDLSNFKNRTTLARKLIEETCPLMSFFMTDKQFELEVIKYINNPEDFECKNANYNVKLPNINRVFQEQNKKIREKYFHFEKESIRKAFGENFINYLDNTIVMINTGFKGYYSMNISPTYPESNEIVKSSHDLFVLFFPQNETSLYYGLIRNNFSVSLIKEDDDPKLFRKLLGLEFYTKPFHNDDFLTTLKTISEKFDDFATNVAKERADALQKQLDEERYDQTWKKWWNEFGLSLIPFYVCATDIHGKSEQASLACPIDLAVALPVIGKLASVTVETTKKISRPLLIEIDAALKTLTFRVSMRSIFEIESESLTKLATKLSENLLTKEMFKTLDVSAFRLFDPGFELAHILGINGIGVIEDYINIIEKQNVDSFEFFKQTLTVFKDYILSSMYSANIDEIFNKNMSTIENFSGNRINGLSIKDIEEIRKVPGYKGMPIVFDQVIYVDERILNKIIKTGLSKTADLYINHRNINFKNSISDIRIYNKEIFCRKIKVKSSTEESLCFRINRKKAKELLEQDAIDMALASKKAKLTSIQIEIKLRNYYFPDGNITEMNFVTDWVKNENLEEPSWSKIYKIDEPKEFLNLRYKKKLDSEALTEEEANKRIESLYSADGRQIFDTKSILKEFQDSKACFTVTFEDYLALLIHQKKARPLSHFTLGGNTDLARRLRYALYRLAIRQMDEDDELFVPVLYRGEVKELMAYKELFESEEKEFKLERFTSTSRAMHIAFLSRELPQVSSEEDWVRILYIISFPPKQKYLRASVEEVILTDNFETVLLPGSHFNIEYASRYIENGKNYAIVKLTYVQNTVENVQNAMKNINILKQSKTILKAR